MKAGLSAFLLMVMLPATAQHQTKAKQKQEAEPDTMLIDSARVMGMTKNGQSLTVKGDSTHQRKHRDWATWKPEPKRALWLALVLPGATPKATPATPALRRCVIIASMSARPLPPPV